MKTTLVIMAAGIGSRFGGGIKQLAPVGLNGEIIMDYSKQCSHSSLPAILVCSTPHNIHFVFLYVCISSD